MAKPPFAKLNFAPAVVNVRQTRDGGFVLTSGQEIAPYARCLGDLLRHWAERQPDRVFLAEREGNNGWRQVTFGEAWAAARAIGQSLLDRGLTPERPVLILSDNSVDHGLLTLGAMHVGIPAVPISPAYSLMSQDHAKLKHILALVEPGLIYANDGAKFEKALKSVDLGGAELVVSANPPETLPATAFDDLLTATPGEAADRAFAMVGPDTCAKILFTSGSTDMPKGVINTHRMLCSNQQAIAQVWPFLSERPPLILDWLPWNHTFGGNHNFNMMLRHGGALYIDDGKPVPGLIEKTVRNLREISPTLYFNVPRGFDMLLPYLEKYEDLRNGFFRQLDLIFYAGAALPQNLWEWLEELSIKSRGKRVRFVSAWGATETAPMITTVHFDIDRAGVIGLPAPGAEVKFVPSGGKYEMRVKGPNITPGYHKRPDLTAKCFDEQGYYCTGDAGRFADPNDPAKGIVFDGRTAEDFKLTSGTWVHVGALRIKAIAACAPVISDAVVTGHDRDEVGLLAFANQPGCASLCPDASPSTPLAALLQRREVRDQVVNGLRAMAKELGGGSSTKVTRVILMEEPPSIDANEITDKGYINQRAVLMRRARLVEQLYADEQDPEVIRV